jgi:alkylation response protein AidB-like acyl-CoA dehydrogenase
LLKSLCEGLAIVYDLQLTPEQHEIRDTVREFVEREIKPVVLHPERLQALEHSLPLELVRAASGLGLRALRLGEESGGANADALTCSIVLEELGAGDAHIAATLAETARIAPELFERTLTPRLRDRYLPRFVDDDEFHLAHVGVAPETELGWGYSRSASIVPALALQARRESGGNWLLEGEARFVANAPLAKLFVVEARVDDKPGGSVLLLVSPESAGLQVRDQCAIANEQGGKATIAWYHGVRGTVSCKACRVPEDHVLQPGAAASLRYGLLGEDRGAPYLQAIALGVGRAACEAAVAYAKLRVQGGRPIVEHQAIGRILADAATRLSVARSIVWQAAWASDHREAYADRSLPDLPLATVAKVYTAQAVHEAVELAAECFGAMGVMRDMPLHKYLHDARIFLQSGTSNAVAKFRIAEALVGYRREADRPVT